MDGIFWSPQVKKRLEEEMLFPAREELLHLLAEYRAKEKEFVQEHEIYETPFSLMPHGTLSPSVHISFATRRQMIVRSTVVLSAIVLLLGGSIPGVLFLKNALALRNQISQEAPEIAVHLENGARALESNNFVEADQQFNDAYHALDATNEKLNTYGAGIFHLLAMIPFHNPIRSGSNLVGAALHFSASGKKVAELVQQFSSLSLSDLISTQDGNGHALNLASVASAFLGALDDVQKAQRALDNVSREDIPVAFLDKFDLLKKASASSSAQIKTIIDNQKILLSLLGTQGPRRYLLVFENSSELRANGGFVGNVALVKISQGIVEKLVFYDVYDLDGQLVEHIIPPRPIQDISSAWSLHDANWFFDFPSSARKISSLYEKDGGGTPDGVIALTSSLGEDMLSVLGPVTLQDGEIIRGDNFVDVMNDIGEKNKNNLITAQNTVLEQIFNTLLSRVNNLNKEQVSVLVALFERRIESKDIQIFLANQDEEKFIASLGVSGAQLKVDENAALQEGIVGQLLHRAHANVLDDALAVVHSNINGFKTDRVIDEKINVQVSINPDGFVDHTVTIVRKHNGFLGVPLMSSQNYTFYNKVNKDYIRLYVPADATLISASGLTKLAYTRPLDYDRMKFVTDPSVDAIDATSQHDDLYNVDIFKENGRKVFAGWDFVSPGESVVLSFTYRTRLASNQSWAMALEKQAGSSPDVDVSVRFPANWNMAWKTPENVTQNGNNFMYNGSLTTNQIFGAIIKQ